MRALEERGIGRPSTYASIIGTIIDRGYVFKRGTALVPSWLAFATVGLLEQHFGSLVDYDFTAEMEEDLDRIANGEMNRVDWLRRFYFGERGGDGRRELRGPGAARARRRASATSTPARSTRSRSATTSSCGSAATARTCSAARTARSPRNGRRCPRTWRPTS